MSNPYLCPIWKVPADVNLTNGDYADVRSSAIPYLYRISGSAEPLLKAFGDRERARLTSWIIDQHLLGDIPFVTADVVDEAAELASMGILQRCDRLLMAVAECCPDLGEAFAIAGQQTEKIKQNKCYARAWSECINDRELTGLIQIAADNGFGKNTPVGFILDLKGLVRLEEMKRTQTASTQAFVAMWFDASMTEAYKCGIYPALRNVGFSPMRIDNKEHANKIDDEIIAEIRRSRFVVADFTSEQDKPRGGVYYEAGFAMGLGLPVIWTCRANMIGSVHFDTRQFNHITWTEPDELRLKLEKRIGAVIGDGPLRRTALQ